MYPSGLPVAGRDRSDDTCWEAPFGLKESRKTEPDQPSIAGGSVSSTTQSDITPSAFVGASSHGYAGHGTKVVVKESRRASRRRRGPHFPWTRVEQTAEPFRDLGGSVTLQRRSGKPRSRRKSICGEDYWHFSHARHLGSTSQMAFSNQRSR